MDWPQQYRARVTAGGPGEYRMPVERDEEAEECTPAIVPKFDLSNAVSAPPLELSSCDGRTTDRIAYAKYNISRSPLHP
jgi:hypothetical protein